MKGRRAHVVPLPWQAVKLLSDVQKITGGLRFVFNGGRGRDEPIHFGTFYYMFQAIGFEKRMTPHGFRAMAATWFNEQGWRPQAIERQLAHIGGGSHQARRVYDRAEHMLNDGKCFKHGQTILISWSRRPENLLLAAIRE